MFLFVNSEGWFLQFEELCCFDIQCLLYEVNAPLVPIRYCNGHLIDTCIGSTIVGVANGHNIITHLNVRLQ